MLDNPVFVAGYRLAIYRSAVVSIVVTIGLWALLLTFGLTNGTLTLNGSVVTAGLLAGPLITGSVLFAVLEWRLSNRSKMTNQSASGPSKT
jgi:hypothetical protein